MPADQAQRKSGPKQALHPDVAALMLRDYDSQQMTVREIAQRYGLSRSGVYKYISRLRPQQGRKSA